MWLHIYMQSFLKFIQPIKSMYAHISCGVDYWSKQISIRFFHLIHSSRDSITLKIHSCLACLLSHEKTERCGTEICLDQGSIRAFKRTFQTAFIGCIFVEGLWGNWPHINWAKGYHNYFRVEYYYLGGVVAEWLEHSPLVLWIFQQHVRSVYPAVNGHLTTELGKAGRNNGAPPQFHYAVRGEYIVLLLDRIVPVTLLPAVGQKYILIRTNTNYSITASAILGKADKVTGFPKTFHDKGKSQKKQHARVLIFRHCTL